MKKDVTRKKKPDQPTSTRWMVLLGVGVVCSGLGIYAVKNQWFNSTIFLSSYQRGQTWLVERKHHLQNGLAKKVEKVKKMSIQQMEADQPIHFEFYTTLPNMKLEEAKRNKQ